MASMSSPDMVDLAAEAAATKKDAWDLGKGCELLIEWSQAGAASSSAPPGDRSCHLKLVSGTAEVFGSELAVGQRVEVFGKNLACFTFHGAKLELEYGASVSPPTAYTVAADETPMVQYANLHAALQSKRDEGRKLGPSGGRTDTGPRCLIAGPVDVGKTTLTRILTNYAVRAGGTPLLVDLDMGQSMITVPGTVSAVLIEDIADVRRGEFNCDNPLTFFYGHANPSENMDLYKQTVERLAVVLDTFLSSNANSIASSSGMFVNTMGWVDGQGYELLLHAIECLKVDTVLVIGHDRLYNQLKNKFAFTKKNPAEEQAAESGMKVEIVKVARSDGVVARDASRRKAAREKKIHGYFYGPTRELNPFSRSVQISQVSVYRVGGGPMAPLSALPIGTANRDASDRTKVQKISVQRDLTHSVLAVSHAKDPEDILSSNVAGFIHVTEVDVQRGSMTYLSPSPTALPSNILVAGTVKCFL